LAIHPESIEIKDSKGASAIHVALTCQASAIHYALHLVDDDDDSAERLELLLECGGSHALCVQDSNEGTPLHQACDRGYPRDVIMILVANHSSALNVRATVGMTPLDRFRQNNQNFLTKYNYTGRHWEERYNELADTVITVLTGAPVYCSDLPSLHELLHNQEGTPDIAKFFICALRDQASLKDDNGNLPLHIVASRYSDNHIMYGKVIELLLEVYPAAC
jgi:ankyrin repeat protein